MPDKAKELGRPFELGQICVYFAGLDGRPNPSTSGSVESRRQVWQLLVRHKFRRDGGGVYGLIDAACLLLVGFLPLGAAGRLRLEQESAPEVIDGLWASFITFSCDAPVLPMHDPEAGPNLVRAAYGTA